MCSCKPAAMLCRASFNLLWEEILKCGNREAGCQRKGWWRSPACWAGDSTRIKSQSSTSTWPPSSGGAMQAPNRSGGAKPKKESTNNPLYSLGWWYPHVLPEHILKPCQGVETTGYTFLGCVCIFANFVISIECWKYVFHALQAHLQN